MTGTKTGILKIRDAALKQKGICDHCLGRQISLKYKGIPCEQIGAALRKAKTEKEFEVRLKKKLKAKESKKCGICRGLFSEIKKFDKELPKAKKEEFTSFLCACRIPGEIQEAEENLWTQAGTEFCEPAKKEINRLFGGKIFELFAKDKKRKLKIDIAFPDVIFLFDFVMGRMEIIRNPLYLYGKYKKFVFIPQTKWPCRECKGRGCEKCKGTGKQYQETVEELAAQKVLEKTWGTGSKFHGAGREDISARMLGTGRPFVLEIANPMKRFIDLKKLEEEINRFARGKIEVSGLRASGKKEVQFIKTIAPHKKYVCIVECGGEINKEDLEKLEKFFKGKEIAQKTPQRVLHRRADKTRRRKIIYSKCEFISEKEFRAEIEAEAGTYIKELISGDEDRTKPSFSGLLGKKCACKQLDVVEIKIDADGWQGK